MLLLALGKTVPGHWEQSSVTRAQTLQSLGDTAAPEGLHVLPDCFQQTLILLTGNISVPNQCFPAKYTE